MTGYQQLRDVSYGAIGMGESIKSNNAVKIEPRIPDKSRENARLGIAFDLRAINIMPIPTKGNATAKMITGSNFDMYYPFEIKPYLSGYRHIFFAAQWFALPALRWARRVSLSCGGF